MTSLGAIYRRLKRYEESIEILERAVDEGRQSADVNYNLGFTYREMGNWDDAIEAFSSVGIFSSAKLLFSELLLLSKSKRIPPRALLCIYLCICNRSNSKYAGRNRD